MRTLWLALGGILVATVVLYLATSMLYARRLLPREQPAAMPLLEANRTDITVNTARIGSDDPVETGVAVAQIVYPATEVENTPGAVILARRDRLAEAMIAVSRVSHFPINAPLQYVDADGLLELTRDE